MSLAFSIALGLIIAQLVFSILNWIGTTASRHAERQAIIQAVQDAYTRHLEKQKAIEQAKDDELH